MITESIDSAIPDAQGCQSVRGEKVDQVKESRTDSPLSIAADQMYASPPRGGLSSPNDAEINDVQFPGDFRMGEADAPDTCLWRAVLPARTAHARSPRYVSGWPAPILSLRGTSSTYTLTASCWRISTTVVIHVVSHNSRSSQFTRDTLPLARCSFHSHDLLATPPTSLRARHNSHSASARRPNRRVPAGACTCVAGLSCSVQRGRSLRHCTPSRTEFVRAAPLDRLLRRGGMCWCSHRPTRLARRLPWISDRSPPPSAICASAGRRVGLLRLFTTGQPALGRASPLQCLPHPPVSRTRVRRLSGPHILQFAVHGPAPVDAVPGARACAEHGRGRVAPSLSHLAFRHTSARRRNGQEFIVGTRAVHRPVQRLPRLAGPGRRAVCPWKLSAGEQGADAVRLSASTAVAEKPMRCRARAPSVWTSALFE
ncbi:hypothetical protein HYPSUDRAFT_205047 [Hypholoma sublateritium FD-334 SS-4]|uniref:Uncharacterized protein n=1 Tax=Hypholoma sublateritium (strain FD-334 SS-4) TaxID=945553 RepID=A0A0D2NPX5_HYPSF|nr:hypothetical protein HYPSUDRAFT_205047 [Hypholoma sublateritium FD-334 SS-4]